MERLVALEEYAQATLLARVLLVCIMAPLPVLFVVLGLVCVPLRDQNEGLWSNYGILIWSAVLVIFGSCSMVDQLRFFAAQIKIRLCSVVVISAFLSFVPVMASIAQVWAFPTPFSVLMLAPINAVSFLIAGVYFFRSALKDEYYRNRFKYYGVFLVLVGWLLIFYPTYTIIYAQTAGAGYEVTALLLLSVVWTVFQNAFACSVAHIEDAVPQLVIFTADYFNAVYLATNMQSISSISSVLIMFGIDSEQLALVIRWLLRRLRLLENQVDSNRIGGSQPCPNVLFKAITLTPWLPTPYLST